MSYEIDFIGVGDQSKQDADAICFRWKTGQDIWGNPIYKVGVFDGGFQAHGEEMTKILNKYYFGDPNGEKSPEQKVLDFICVSHPDQDHTAGIPEILENFKVKKIYMNRPWIYSDELWECVTDKRINLTKHLRDIYPYIADIEDIAVEKEIPIYEAFEGTVIESCFRILSPAKDFYFQLLCESEKTLLQTKESALEKWKNTLKHILASAKDVVLALSESWTHEELRDNVSTTPENESSIILLGNMGNGKILLTGDAGIRALEKAIAYAGTIGVSLKTEVKFYQIPHHGSRHNVSPTILNRLLGSILPEDTAPTRTAFASSAKDSDHPYKIVTNAFLRRGVDPFSNTSGHTIHHNTPDMPNRGWSSAESIPFSDNVEEWDD